MPQDTGTGAGAARTPGPAPTPAAAVPESAPAPDLKPHQSDSLLSSVMGADIDLSDYGLSDAKLVVAQMIDRVPTAAPSRSRRTAAE